MNDEESELEIAERHIREGEAAVKRQRQILKSPVVKGEARAVGEQLLAKLALALELHYKHRDRLLGSDVAYHSGIDR
ncbi:MAG: hypothetical protein AB7O49_04260 [Sphingomonadales bacterium]